MYLRKRPCLFGSRECTDGRLCVFTRLLVHPCLSLFVSAFLINGCLNLDVWPLISVCEQRAPCLCPQPAMYGMTCSENTLATCPEVTKCWMMHVFFFARTRRKSLVVSLHRFFLKPGKMLSCPKFTWICPLFSHCFFPFCVSLVHHGRRHDVADARSG